ncbi:MAG: 2,3-epoxybenzoyl-CoA dihydrolase [Planctomycetes bacterium]|nr:2,3-epoxybenzoyl-CoA dihydrolase [Planctomycetota bacterium]
MPEVSFQTNPNAYRHWRVEFDGPIARVLMQVDKDHPLREGYELKLNSYDLGVDIELADIVRRMRFEHPDVNTIAITSGHHQVFCAGANINMLGRSAHAWKVNFCKFTNETRCELEELSRTSGYRTIAALNGTCAGGGYELAMACDEIWLVDDGNSAVSLPETPLLGVLPGTGGLTRLVDKRKVRRDRADIFCTLAEGVRGKRALEWKLVDQIAPRSKFEEKVAARAKELAATGAKKGDRKGIALGPIQREAEGNIHRYSSLTMAFRPEKRTAELTIVVPPAKDAPRDAAAIFAEGDRFWPLRLWREIEYALLDLRINRPDTGLVTVRTRGDLDDILAWDDLLVRHKDFWLAGETILLAANVLRRLERTACSFFALIDAESAFGGSLLELAWACDRAYMLDAESVSIARSPLNEGALPMTTGITRSACRLLGAPAIDRELQGDYSKMDAQAAEERGLVTEIYDALDFEDTVRIACEERVSLSPDALTGMEANLRFAGPESMESKVFGRLTAWQNWIFIRPNATGPKGALTLYGKPDRPEFDFKRV